MSGPQQQHTSLGNIFILQETKTIRLITYVMFCFVDLSFTGHLSRISEWQLIKIDYKAIFSRRCMDGDYQTWNLHNKVMYIMKAIDLMPTSR